MADRSRGDIKTIKVTTIANCPRITQLETIYERDDNTKPEYTKALSNSYKVNSLY